MTEPSSRGEEADRFRQSGLVTEEQIREALAIQEEVRSLGVKPEPLSAILIQKGYLTRAQARELEAGSTEAEGMPEIPGFEILGTIGKGGMGTVYKGFQKSMARDVAIKILFPETARQKGYVDRFFREARMAARVHHPNIIAAYDVGEQRGHYYLVMEYCPGQSLKNIIFEGDRVALFTALDIALQIARALENAHANKLVHRDIKPENILIDEDGTAKLCDMGLAKELAPGAKGAEEMAGTPLYISPEQASGSDEVDIRSDIYSLGATLYHMILGRPPFLGTDPRRIMRMHIEDELVPPARRDPSIPAPLSALVVKMMAKKPGERFANPTALVAAMERVRDKLKAPEQEAAPAVPAGPPPSPAPPPPPPGRKAPPLPKKTKPKRKRRSSRSQAPLWIALAVAVALIAGGLLLFSGGGGKTPSRGSRDEPENGGEPAEPGPDTPPGPGDESPKPVDVKGPSAFEAAKTFLAEHPEDLQGALERFRKAAAEAKGGALEDETARRVEQIEARLRARETKRFEKAASEATRLESEGRVGPALNVYRAYLEEGPVGDGHREKAEEEIDRLSLILQSRWNADATGIELAAENGDFDEAIRIVQDAVDPGKGYADRDLLETRMGVDVDGLLRDLEARRRAWQQRIAEEAGPRADALEKRIARLLDTGHLEKEEALPPRPLAARFPAALATLTEALADPALAPVAGRLRKKKDAMQAVCSLLDQAEKGFRAVSRARTPLRFKNRSAPTRIASVLNENGKVLVKTASPSATYALREALENLDQASLADVLEAAADDGGVSPAECFALGQIYLWSTPGAIEDAARKARGYLEAASKSGFPVEDALETLETRKTSMQEASVRRALERALSLASSSDKGKKKEALSLLEDLLDKHGDAGPVRDRRAEIEATISGLRRAVGPAGEVEIDFLKGEALAFDPGTGDFEMAYKFTQSQAAFDWVRRNFGDRPDEWFQHLLDNYLGRGPEVGLRGGRLTLSGGGYLVWKPKLTGDLDVEVRFSAGRGEGVLVLFHALDTGGFAFHSRLDWSALSAYGGQVGVDIPAGAGAGISIVDLNWPQDVEPLAADADFELRPKAFYKLKIVRRGATISAALFDGRGKEQERFEAEDASRKAGRIALCVLQSELSVSEIFIKGRFDEDWLRRARQGTVEHDAGDMPGFPAH